MKLHPGTHQYPADGPGYQPVWEMAETYGLHVLSHSFPPDEALARLARTYANVTLQVAHAASFPGRLPGLYAVCATCPNVYLDLCGSLLWRGCLEDMVEGVSAGRVIYGSDIPFLDPRPQLGRVALAQIGEDEKRAVLGQNARTLWKRAGAPKRSATTTSITHK